MEDKARVGASATENLDPYQSPPNDLKRVFKEWKKYKDGSLLQESIIVLEEEWHVPRVLDSSNTSALFERFMNHGDDRELPRHIRADEDKTDVISCFESKIIPGLLVIPSFLPSECQTLLLDRMLNRDLSKSAHKTNLDLHYDIQYPELGKSFLDYDKKAVSFVAKDPALHPNLSMERAMTSKLRWMTLGGQYDWTEKRYPDETPPVFPPDLYNLLHGAFPTMKPQAAIVNFYSPGDTLSLHRDVSEDVDRGLVSISIGCDAIFLIGLVEDNDLVSQYQVLRLRSGDAVYMTGKSRYAWHGVPKIIPNTCPKNLENWPGLTHPQWEGYMKTKRINLNVRQMYDG